MAITKTFPVIGIGASAGGLEALKILFTDLPPDSNAAYVVISHLDPEGTSMTAEILGRVTNMPVVQAADNCAIEPNHVYAIPPNAYLTVSDYTLKLHEMGLAHGLRLPVDMFFESLATQLKQNAVGIILSGTGHDGSAGVQTISTQGGLVIVQAPESASYDGMPLSAIETGAVDVICPINRLAENLVNVLQQHLIAVSDELPQDAFPPIKPDILQEIISLLHQATGADFTQYRLGTMHRRIARRMAVHFVETPEQYLALLESNPGESEALFKDLLIGVTDFFRDKEAFEALDKQVLAELVDKKSSGDSIRIWVPGCATGEEAYSIAILLIEQLTKANKHCDIRVFASDIDEHALAVGRAGRYSKSRLANMSATRLEQFFTQINQDYQVIDKLRGAVTFANQNIISDPPISRLDLISLRNLLIYLSPASQRNILAVCHFALQNDGFLFLGTAETTGHQPNLFKTIDRKWRIYRKSPGAKPSARDLTLGYGKPIAIERHLKVMGQPAEGVQWKNLIQQQLLQEYAPAAVLVNSQDEVLYFSGPTTRYLNQPPGKPTQDLLLMVNHELREPIRSGLQQARTNDQDVTVEHATAVRGDRLVQLKLTFKPLTVADPDNSLLLVTFEDQPAVEAKPVAIVDAPQLNRITPETAPLVLKLQRELELVQAQLRDSLSGHETANEELQATNEEMTSINEELQSSNEELESSKEELQSMNEELVTMNSQLQENVKNLAEANDGLNNFISSTEIATLFLDREFRIGRFTPATRSLLNLIETDVGRPITDIRPGVVDPNIIKDAQYVQERLKPVETEVTGEEGRRYIRRILPYRTQDDHIAGTVITYIDITDRRRADEQTRLLATVLRDSNDAIIIQDMDGNITAWNRGAQKMYGWTEHEALTMNIADIVPHDERENLDKMLAGFKAGKNIPSFETRRLTSTGRELDVWITITPVLDDNKKTCGFATTERDITQRKIQENAITDAWKSEADIAERSRFLAIASHDLRQPMQSLGLLNSAMLKTNADPEAQRLLKIQQATLVDMRWLLDTLLDTSNLDAGTITVRKQNVAVSPLIQRLHAELSGEADQKGLDFSISATDSIVYTDPGLLAQMLRNLVGNAIRYTRKGSVKLICEPVDNDLLFSVSDTGIGIAKEQQPFIFNEFHQVPQGESAEQQGLGLGLAIVARIAKLLDIQIELESEQNRGSTFSFRIPVGTVRPGTDSTDTAELTAATETTDTPDTGSASEPPERPATDAIPTIPGPVNTDTKILLIDDEPSVLDSTKIRLSLEGFQISPAATPEQALAAIEQFTPDLIITDQILGHELTGVDLARKIRGILGQSIPAIVVTGDTSLSAGQINLERSQLMRKPLKAEELLVVIHQSLES